MPAEDIVIRGAREHNLRNVNVTIPRNKLVVMTGVSGSGKSSLAFDTLYAEGQRRYVESLSSYARQFMGQMPKPDVDLITGLAPSISIQQKSSGRNPRSTVGTITEIYDYLRVLYARVGSPACYQCGQTIAAQTADQIVEAISQIPADTRFIVLAPLAVRQKGEFKDLFADLLKKGYLRARVDGKLVQLGENLQLDRQMKHTIEVVVDRLISGKSGRNRLAEAVENALKLADRRLIVSLQTEDDIPPQTKPVRGKKVASKQTAPLDDDDDLLPHLPPNDRLFSCDYACATCGISYEPPSPQLFSFNSPQGMCLDCDGLGMRHEFAPDLLIEDPELTIQKGAIRLLGKLSKVGRWRRHFIDGAARVIEQKCALSEGTLLKTRWNKLPKEAQQFFLFGLGSQQLVFSYRHGGGVWKHSGTFAGVIGDLLDDYKRTNNPLRRKQLERYLQFTQCSRCDGTRLNSQARSYTLTSTSDELRQQRGLKKGELPRLSLPEICGLSTHEAGLFFSELQLDATGQYIAGEALKEIRGRLGFLLRCGLDYLALDRAAPTLSGGETQRIRLAGQIGSGLVGVVYILDEPSIGLHPRDNQMLLDSLCDLRDQGNTVIVVEHDDDTMRAADHLIDFGPGPGVRGGEVVSAGTFANLLKSKESVTGAFLSGRRKIDIPAIRRPGSGNRLVLRGGRHHNLQNVTAEFPLGTFICITGVSGSGKSSLINDTLWPLLNVALNKGEGTPGEHDAIEGLDFVDKAIDIDQSPIGRTPRSNPATYVKLFDLIRDLYTNLPEAKVRGFKAGRFSFNVAGGRCEACEGNGSNKLEMDFLADLWVTCPVCQGHRFGKETLEVQFKGRSIADVLEMDVQQALTHFENIPKIRQLLQTLHDVGLDYIKLGQPSPTLSGGEAQRIKLARELGKRSTGKTIYILDEPTTGLHFVDIEHLLRVLHGFVDKGNTVIVVEHNLDVIKTADYVIDLGPEGGAGGGHILTAGTPEEVARVEDSYTGRALQAVLPGFKSGKTASASALANKARSRWQVAQRLQRTPGADRNIVVKGAAQHNLQNLDVQIPRDEMSVFCGPSGSGKSSLAMDTLYAEGQRRYVESLSSYARQFLGQMAKPRVDSIQGLQPAIAIEQKTVGHTPRSTVGTVTEIYDYLRVLFARLGKQHCPTCGEPVQAQTRDEVIDRQLARPAGTKLLVLAPQEVLVGQQYETLWERLQSQGFRRVRIDGTTYTLDEVPEIDRKRRHQVEVVVDRVTVNPSSRSRIADSIEKAFDLGRGVLRLAIVDEARAEKQWKVEPFSLFRACEACQRSFEEQTPHHFSFNSPLGWCPSCDGLGVEQGTSLASLVGDPSRTLLEGAVTVWPSPEQNPLWKRMLYSLEQECGLPLDVPFSQLDSRFQRLVLHGTGDLWIPLVEEESIQSKLALSPAKTSPPRKPLRPPSQFQYKGLFPAIEEASRVSFTYRSKLHELIGEAPCSECQGSRLAEEPSAVRLMGKTIKQFCDLPLSEALKFLQNMKLTPVEKKIAGDLLTEATGRLGFLVDVGLHYLTLGRTLPTLSGGESQRIRLAGQLGRALTGVLYVLDEPTIGLHPSDNSRLLQALKRLRDLGNTVVLVEHDREVMQTADHVFDFGPGAGRLGGRIVAQGTPKQIERNQKSLTGNYLSNRLQIPIPSPRRTIGLPPGQTDENALQVPVSVPLTESQAAAPKAKLRKPPRRAQPKTVIAEIPKAIQEVGNVTPPGGGWLELLGARHNNLRNVDLQIPLGTFTAITGVSGSGKSSLIHDTLALAVARALNRSGERPAAHDSLLGLKNLQKLVVVDQQPLGNTPSSNPATYTGVFEEIRQLFASMPESKIRGYSAARFSFNRPGGRCEACEGNGQKCIEMHFLPDVWIECAECRGQRYNTETLGVKFKDRSISDVLNLPIGEALELFHNIPKIRGVLATLSAIGLDYLTLGQPAPTLSGGEAQRVKLAAELARPQSGKSLYLLDEPTTGLHFDDIRKLLSIMHSLVDAGNTVVVIEHNLDVIKTADWIVDLGPAAGSGGGYIVTAGTPEDVVAYALKHQPSTDEESLAKGRKRVSPPHDAAASQSPGATSNLRSLTGEALAPVLQSSERGRIETFDAQAALKKQAGDVEAADLGKHAKMPWETDGRNWHVARHIAMNGRPCRWDVRILPFVEDLVRNTPGFAEIAWNARSAVEVTAAKPTNLWFLHIMTGSEWTSTLKFRVPARTFSLNELRERLDLTPFDELPDLPIQDRAGRIQLRPTESGLCELAIVAHSLADLDNDAFRGLFAEAAKAYLAAIHGPPAISEKERLAESLEQLTKRRAAKKTSTRKST